MSKPLICWLGHKHVFSFGNEKDGQCDWIYIDAGDDIFALLGERLPAAIICQESPLNPNGIEPATSQLKKLPGFAKTRLLSNTSELSSFVISLPDILRPIFYISDEIPCFELKCAMHLTFDQFLKRMATMNECYLFFDAKLKLKFTYARTMYSSFFNDIWPTLSQFRGFVKQFMHSVDQEMTPQIDLQMFAMTKHFPPNCYPDLRVKPIDTLFEPTFPLPAEVNVCESKQTLLKDMEQAILTSQNNIAMLVESNEKRDAKIKNLEDIVDALVSLFCSTVQKNPHPFCRFLVNHTCNLLQFTR